MLTMFFWFCAAKVGRFFETTKFILNFFEKNITNYSRIVNQLMVSPQTLGSQVPYGQALT